MSIKKIVIGIYSSSTPIISLFPNKTKRAESFLKENEFSVIYGNLSFINNGCG